MYRNQTVKTLHFEPSQLCNASCPVCNRRFFGGPKNPNVKNEYTTVNQVKSWFSPTFITGLERLILCGNYGDPMTNPELIEILEYFREISPNLYITIHTNASGRTYNWWKRIGELIGKQGSTYFSIDGLEDTNHIYRRGTRWDTIMNSVAGYIDGGGNAIWDFLIFDHNKHQVSDAEELSLQLGFSKFTKKYALGFSKNENGLQNPIKVFKENGEFDYYIYPNGEFQKLSSNPEPLKVGDMYDVTAQPIISELEPEYISHMESVEIDCMADTGKEIFVNSYGYVFPCCFTAGKFQADKSFENSQFRKFVADHGGENVIDLNFYSLDEILDNDIYNLNIQDTWKSKSLFDKRLLVCANFCGKYKDNQLLCVFGSMK